MPPSDGGPPRFDPRRPDSLLYTTERKDYRKPLKTSTVVFLLLAGLAACAAAVFVVRSLGPAGG